MKVVTQVEDGGFDPMRVIVHKIALDEAEWRESVLRSALESRQPGIVDDLLMGRVQAALAYQRGPNDSDLYSLNGQPLCTIRRLPAERTATGYAMRLEATIHPSP